MGVAHHTYSRSPPSERIDLTCAAPVYTVRLIRSNRTRGSHAYSLNALESACPRHGCACRNRAGGESRGSGIRAGTEARAGATYPAASVDAGARAPHDLRAGRGDGTRAVQLGSLGQGG